MPAHTQQPVIASVPEAADLLRAAGIEEGPREARRIWSSLFSPGYSDRGEIADRALHRRFSDLVHLRASRMPMSHILGKRAFYEHEFLVTPDVLDPRPDTETLVVEALEKPWQRILDLGTGSGAIAISLLAARRDASGLATDLSAAALGVATKNALRIGVSDRLELREGSWFDPLEQTDSRFDLIVSNPPYIALDEMADLSPEVLHEPRMALTDEGDGLSCYRRICAGADSFLAPEGWVMVEIGPTQGSAVLTMMRDNGLQNTAIRQDLDGRDRVVLGQKAA